MRNSLQFYDVRMVDHLEVFDFTSDSCLCLWVLGIDCRLANTFESDPLACQAVNGDLKQVLALGY